MIRYSGAILMMATGSVLLASCGTTQPQMTGANAVLVHVTTGAGYKSLHSFGNGYDGQQPQASLINVNGVLYGTTYKGGEHSDGTVFSITDAGAEKILYSFKGGNDGANPAAALLAMKGLLYGTTAYGGIPEYYGCNAGTVFSINTLGVEKVVYRFYGFFCNKHYYYDGANPLASLISVGDKLYGTTSNGGRYTYDGTVFRVSPRGKEKVLHSFFVYGDGSNPAANLLNVGGTLYGVTRRGGQFTYAGYGTVFAVSTAGAEKTLYSFPSGGSNGAGPVGGLINVGGVLYGTCANGGPSDNSGIAFSITTSGSLTVLHNFGSGTDGRNPDASLLNVGGTLYGTTAAGGEYGKGTIFEMTLTGKENVLHSFGYGSDGETPLAGLVDVKGTLYGTTSAGGTNGDGMIFALQIKR